jgi:hypothetical protein
MPGADAPAASCAKCRKHTSVVAAGLPGWPGIPTHDGFNGFLRALPGDRLIVTVAGGFRFLQTRLGSQNSANLTPAPGRQDHTTSPSAAPVYANRLRPKTDFGGQEASPGLKWQSDETLAKAEWHLSSACRWSLTGNPPCNHTSRPTLPRPPHPTPRSVTIAIRPCVGQDGNGYRGDLG